MRGTTLSFDAVLARRPLAIAVAVCALALGGCGSPAGVRTTVQPLSPDTLKLQAPDETGRFTQPLQPWWRAWGDDSLSNLVDQALRDSPSLAVVRSRLVRAEAMRQQADSVTQPQLQARGEVARQRYTEHGLFPPPLAGSVRENGTLQLEAAWELDLFGRHRAELAAAVGETRAAEAEAHAAQLLLSTQVARTHLQLARLLSLRDVAARTLAQREETLKLIQQRVAAGLDTTVELRQGEASLPDARQQLEALNEQIALTRHALAALLGQGPDALDGHAPELGRLRLPADPGAMPVDLLSRRADVMAARWRVESAGQLTRAARASYYPNVDLRAFGGYGAIGLDRLLDPGSLQWGVLPALNLPLFDGGRREAGLRSRVADEDQAIARYNQTVLQAVQEVADALGSERSLQRQRAEQAAAQQASEAAYRLARERYQAGLGSYLNVLSAETAVLAQRRLAVDLQARQLDNQAALVRALGGGLSPVSTASPASPVSPIPTSSNPPTRTATPHPTGVRS